MATRRGFLAAIPAALGALGLIAKDVKNDPLNYGGERPIAEFQGTVVADKFVTRARHVPEQRTGPVSLTTCE